MNSLNDVKMIFYETTASKKKRVEMNYHNYEGKIVEKYSVKLKGWPNSKPGIFNPATLGGWLQLERLLAALESGDCHWVVLNDEELEEKKIRCMRIVESKSIYPINLPIAIATLKESKVLSS